MGVLPTNSVLKVCIKLYSKKLITLVEFLELTGYETVESQKIKFKGLIQRFPDRPVTFTSDDSEVYKYTNNID